jgi:hypothetical protein
MLPRVQESAAEASGDSAPDTLTILYFEGASPERDTYSHQQRERERESDLRPGRLMPLRAFF